MDGRNMLCPREKSEPQVNSSNAVQEEKIQTTSEAAKTSNRPNRDWPRHMTQQDREEAYRRGLMKESWCHVEGKKEQDWLRSTRRHFPKVHNMSTLFNEVTVDEPRCEWKVQEEVNRKERRHFGYKGGSHLTI